MDMEGFAFDLDDIAEGNNVVTPTELQEEKEKQDKWFPAMEKRFQETTALRNLLAKAFTIIIVFWLVGVLLILTGNNWRYRLSDSVLNTLLTTTTIQVLGMMVIILWDIFPGGKKDEQKP